jgi:hypothetical protein
MPGTERPAASRLRIQRPPTTKPHHRNLGRNKKSSNSLLIGHAAEGLSITDSFGANSVSSALDHPQSVTLAERVSTHHAISAVEHLNIADTNFTLLRHTEAR